MDPTSPAVVDAFTSFAQRLHSFRTLDEAVAEFRLSGIGPVLGKDATVWRHYWHRHDSQKRGAAFLRRLHSNTTPDRPVVVDAPGDSLRFDSHTLGHPFRQGRERQAQILRRSGMRAPKRW